MRSVAGSGSATAKHRDSGSSKPSLVFERVYVFGNNGLAVAVHRDNQGKADGDFSSSHYKYERGEFLSSHPNFQTPAASRVHCRLPKTPKNHPVNLDRITQPFDPHV